MRLILSLAIATLGTTLAASAPAGPAERQAANAARLDRFMAQADQGRPISCINLPSIRATKVIDQNTVVYEISSRLKYVNRLRGGCDVLRPDRELITRTPSSMLCSGDLVRVVDFAPDFEYGTCALGEFTPYRKRG